MNKIFQTIRATSFGLAFLLLAVSMQGCGSSETAPAKAVPATGLGIAEPVNTAVPAKTEPPVPADSQIAAAGR